jgi:hypothetical protein
MLDTLPVEIIQRIAAFGPCESTLTLLKVNRKIHVACNNSFVFRSIIESGNDSSTDLPIWRCVPLSLDIPASSWARYALADSKAAQLSKSNNIYWDETLGFVRWGPHLIALRRELNSSPYFFMI